MLELRRLGDYLFTQYWRDTLLIIYAGSKAKRPSFIGWLKANVDKYKHEMTDEIYLIICQRYDLT